MTQFRNFKKELVAPVPTFIGVSERMCIQLVGLRQHIKGVPYQEIPKFWEKFSPYRGWIPGQVDRTIYGALLEARSSSSGFDYFTAVEVSDLRRIGSDWDCLDIPLQRYSVFLHRGHVSELREAQHSIFSRSLTALGFSPRRSGQSVPLSIERYDSSFDLKTGWGGIQVWIPV